MRKIFNPRREVIVSSERPIASTLLDMGKLYFWKFAKLINKGIRVEKYEALSLFSRDRHEQSPIYVLSGTFFLAPYIKKTNPRAKVICWIHNSYDIYFEKYYVNRKDELIEALEVSDAVVTLTDNDLIAYGVHNSNTVKINNPVSIETDGKVADLTSKYVSFTSRYSVEHKGIDYLAHIASRLPEGWKIRFAGDGNDDERENVKKLIHDARAEDKIEFVGALRGEKLLEHYVNSSIFLSTSRWEGFPLVVGEAMAFGLPVVSFENSGLNEVTRNGKYGKIVELGNIEQMIETIVEFTSSLEVRTEFSQKSLERAAMLSVEEITKEWESLIEKM
jgi:glycosyltransferase involved in cell wall biosynthesis